jgi:hypothetical protein
MFYVYHLIDPRDGSVFYVGKGQGRRSSQHARDAKAGRIGNVEKHARITAIHAAGLEVKEHITSRHETERQAYAAERAEIERLRAGLTNVVSGTVSDIDRAKAVAAYWLGRLKTFEHWMDTIRPDQLAAVEKHFGGPRVWDDHYRASLVETAAL